ncbi:hypothetical protein DNTS_000322, partial [Danionella cerebrum]
GLSGAARCRCEEQLAHAPTFGGEERRQRPLHTKLRRRVTESTDSTEKAPAHPLQHQLSKPTSIHYLRLDLNHMHPSALKKLSAYSEGPDTRRHTECPAEEKSSKQLDYYSSVDDIIPKSFPAHEYNLQDCKDSEELPMISQPEQDGDNEYHQPMGRTVTNEEQNPDNTDELNTSKIHQELSVNCRDVSGGGLTACHIFTRTAEHSSSEPKFSSNHQCSKGKEQKSHGAHPRENQLTQRERPREGLHGPECRLEGGGDILGHMQMNEEGQDRVVSCRKEQPELSLSSRNREGAAKSLSTLTATKQNSRIPSYCYSECIPATIHQHQLKRFADTQSQQGAWQSRPLSLMLCRSTEDQTSGTTSMGTKQAEPSSEVEGLANLVQMSSETQNTSACSETSSFECVDVALETKDEVKRGLKTVPKRQIQLKRRDTAEDEGNENNCQTYKGLHPRDLLQRQHSTPAAINQGSHDRDQRAAQAERKQKLQKSFSLDETFCKTQVASSIITNILSKKMQHEQNLRSLDVSDKAFASVNVSNRTITREELATKPNDTPNREPQGESISSQKYCSSNSKKQPKPLGKNGLAPLLSGIGISQVHCSGTEITITSENEKAEKTSPREATLLLPNLNPRVRVSCDSAKGSSWNSSAATNVAICTQASVKTTPEESHTGQGFHEQHNITQISEMKNKEQKAGSMQSTLSPTNVACLISDLEAATEDSTTFKSDDSNVGKEQVKTQGQIPNLVIQTQGKPKAPMHVVRDMRSLVKNTYNMANKSQGDSSQGLDKTASLLQPPQHNLSNKGERKGSRQEEKTLLRKVTPPLPLDRRRDHSATRGRSTMAKPLVESGDKCHIVGYKKVSPIGVTKFASSNPTETLDGKVSIKKPEALVTDPNWTKTNRTELALQQEDSTNINKMVQEISTLSHKDELQYFSASTSGLDDQNRLTQDGLQTPCLQPRGAFSCPFNQTSFF